MCSWERKTAYETLILSGPINGLSVLNKIANRVKPTSLKILGETKKLANRAHHVSPNANLQLMTWRDEQVEKATLYNNNNNNLK